MSINVLTNKARRNVTKRNRQEKREDMVPLPKGNIPLFLFHPFQRAKRRNKNDQTIHAVNNPIHLIGFFSLVRVVLLVSRVFISFLSFMFFFIVTRRDFVSRFKRGLPKGSHNQPFVLRHVKRGNGLSP